MYYLLMEEDNSIIPIRSEDIIDNLDSILEENTIFKVNSNLESISCYIFYIENDRLFNYKKYEIQINVNKLSKKELLALVLKHKTFYSKKFDLVGIYKYEVNLKEDSIKSFCQDPKPFHFITQYHNIEDIHFNPCIEMFNEHNNISLFFSRKQKEEIQEKDKSSSHKNKTQKRVKFNLKKEKDKGKTTSSTSANKTQKTI